MRTMSGHFFERGIKDMEKKFKETQPPLTIPDQIANLQALGLIIPDVDTASKFLNDVSYFRFIKGYSLELKSRNSSYEPGVTFEQLTQLYLFNANFRQLLFSQIERVEINLRCRLSNYFSLKYGAMGYLKSSNFGNYPESFKEGILREIERNKQSPFIRNFRRNYIDGNIPFYAVVEVFSFGTLSKFYKNMKNEDKKEVSALFGANYRYFESWIENIAYVRNICAHYGRLYNAKFTKRPRLYSQDRNKGISEKSVIGTLACIKRLLPNDCHWTKFVEEIDSLLKEYPYVDVSTMEFPENWKELLLA